MISIPKSLIPRFLLSKQQKKLPNKKIQWLKRSELNWVDVMIGKNFQIVQSSFLVKDHFFRWKAQLIIFKNVILKVSSRLETNIL